MITESENRNQFWADLVVEELVRSGVRQFFVSPGSRSTPLVIAAARNPAADCVVHFDERGSSFLALGHARATHRPAACITTSGTAVANCLPAVVEASVDGVPMLVLTADRPPELRSTGANQTIDQVGIFGSHVRWQFDFPPPDAETDPAFVLSTIGQAVHRSTRDRGPVHLNFMYREVLDARQGADTDFAFGPAVGRWIDGTAPFTSYEDVSDHAAAPVVDALARRLAASESGLVVAGRLKTAAEGEAVARVARALGWPLFADVLSKVAHNECVIPHFDLLLTSERFREQFKPQNVLHFGARATSKRLYQWLEEVCPKTLTVVASEHHRIDPIHRVTQRLEVDVEHTGDVLADRLAAAGTSQSTRALDLCTKSARSVSALLDTMFSGRSDLSQPAVARRLCEQLPPDHAVFAAASLPVRELDMYVGAGTRPVTVAGNRGASGIDGTVASAAGFAAGRGEPVALLIGDLALLHDLNSLALLRDWPQPVLVVVVNNDGGGVFSFLPVAGQTDVFERYFAAPHGLRFESAAHMFGLQYRCPESMDEFSEAFDTLARSGKSGIVEVCTDRRANKSLHDEITRQIGDVLSRADLAIESRA